MIVITEVPGREPRGDHGHARQRIGGTAVQKTPRGPYYTQDPKWYDARRGRILKARREGQTLAAIGDTWGITGQRVGQIVMKPKAFRCVRCGAEEEALPTGITNLMGGTHLVYETPPGWWNITTEAGMVMFCADEDVGRVTDEIIYAMDNMQDNR